jgi:prefoldin subunit 5
MAVFNRSLPVLSARIDEMEKKIAGLKDDLARMEQPDLPVDVARLSDIPEPPDLLPLAAKIQELQREIAEVAESVPVLPSDLARKSDIPEPLNLSPVLQRIDSIESEQDAIHAELKAALSSFSAAASELAESVSQVTETMDVVRRDLAETRTWVGDLGRSWQAHRETVQAVMDDAGDAAGLADRIAAIETRAARDCPDLSPVALRLNTVELQLAEIIGGDE